MTSPVALNELIRQHRLLVADLIVADNQVAQLRDQLKAVETVMQLMGYEDELPTYPIRRPSFPIFARGEIMMAIRDIGRVRPQLTGPQEVAREIVAAKGWDSENGMMLAAIVIVFAIIRLNDPPNQIIQSHSQPNGGGKNSQSHATEQPVYLGIFTANDTLAQWIAALAAIGSVGVSIWAVRLVGRSLKETRKATSTAITSNRIAQETAKRQLRAYVLVVECYFESVGDTNFRLVLKIKNFGQTPAYKLSVKVKARTFSIINKMSFTEPDESTSHFTLGPGGTFPQVHVVSELHPILVSAMRAGGEDVYVWGRISYQDCFGAIQQSHFRLLHDGPVKDGSDRFILCAEGNHAT
jgi:hypothetical protein